MNGCQDSESRWEGTLHPGRSKDGDMTGATRPSDISEEKHMWIRLKMVQGGQDTSVTHNILHYVLYGAKFRGLTVTERTN